MALEILLTPLDALPAEPPPTAWAPLGQIPAERGAVFPWFPAEHLLGVARFQGPPETYSPSELVLDAGRQSAAQVGGWGLFRPFPAGVPLTVINTGATPLEVTVDERPEVVTVPAGGRVELSEAIWSAPGWHRVRDTGSAAEWLALLVEPPFAEGWARLAGPGRLVIDFGDVAAGGPDGPSPGDTPAEPVAVAFELWLDGQPLCPAESQPGCTIERRGASQEGRIVLEPVVISASPREGTGSAAEP